MHFNSTSFIKRASCLILFLKTGLLLPQTVSFERYLAGFDYLALPYTMSREKIEKVAAEQACISDPVISTFIGAKCYPDDELRFVHRYYGCFLKSDSITAVVYLKTAPVQLEYWLVEMALYNSKTKKLLDKMLVTEYTIKERESEFSDPVILFSPVEINKDLSVQTEHGLFQITLQGFKTVQGTKEEATDW